MASQNSPAPQMSEASIQASLPGITKQALDWEQKQWADGSVLDNDFYITPEKSSDVTPGSLLKLERETNTSLFTLPPATALSRIIYQSKTLNGSLVPVSAYILWPYSPRSTTDGYQVIAWSHGTSGASPNSAPSHTINLWQHYLAPYNLVQQGYVVVATDYAGLGVAKTASNKPIVHEYLASPAQANDVFYSVQAAQSAFPELGKEFVIIGHSQGGGAAWAAAQRQAKEPVEGYLGAVAISPVTSVLDLPDPVLSFLGVGLMDGVEAYFPEFKPADILTTDGQQRHKIIRTLGANSATSLTLLMECQLFQPGWTKNSWLQKYQAEVVNGGYQIGGPLLVIHGEADQNLDINLTTAAVDKTLDNFPSTQLEYIRLPGLDHGPTMTGSQGIWMDWIADRFAGKPLKTGGVVTEAKTAVPISRYQAALNWYLALAKVFYQTP